MNRRLIAVSLTAVLGLVGACGSSSDNGDTAGSDADVMFAQMMIPHHEQAIELADLALNPAAGASEAVRSLATQIKANQDPEIEFMTSWLTEGGHPLTADDGMDHSSMMSGMLSVDEMDALRILSGAEFDRAWIAAMIAHHEGAIDMARTVLDDGADANIADLATTIIEAQTEEIDTLRTM